MAQLPQTDPIRASSARWQWHCHADPLLFIPWDAVPDMLKTLYVRMEDQIRCHRNGVPGPWCNTCPLGTSTTEGEL